MSDRLKYSLILGAVAGISEFLLFIFVLQKLDKLTAIIVNMIALTAIVLLTNSVINKISHNKKD